MAPPPEYDKEPKAPDKIVASTAGEETKTAHSVTSDQQASSDSKSGNTNSSSEIENNKHVEHLDDGQLKALLDEAITYKCPKDREGMSSLFNELLEEVEQDEQALQAAAREAPCGRVRRSRGGRRALAHSNSLQDLEAEALAAESALRRVRQLPAPPVSARATHGGSLPNDVDKSFLLGEEPRAGYLATVRCVNPPPLAERRVSASDAHHDPDTRDRRSKPPFPMTYTARATLEIGSGAVGSPRALTTTIASNQVRTPPGPPAPPTAPPPWLDVTLHIDEGDTAPLAPTPRAKKHRGHATDTEPPSLWKTKVDSWYRGIASYSQYGDHDNPITKVFVPDVKKGSAERKKYNEKTCVNTHHSIVNNIAPGESGCSSRGQHACGIPVAVPNRDDNFDMLDDKRDLYFSNKLNKHDPELWKVKEISITTRDKFNETDFDFYRQRREYWNKVGKYLVTPSVSSINPTNIRSMTIGKPLAANEVSVIDTHPDSEFDWAVKSDNNSGNHDKLKFANNAESLEGNMNSEESVKSSASVHSFQDSAIESELTQSNLTLTETEIDDIDSEWQSEVQSSKHTDKANKDFELLNVAINKIENCKVRKVEAVTLKSFFEQSEFFIGGDETNDIKADTPRLLEQNKLRPIRDCQSKEIELKDLSPIGCKTQQKDIELDNIPVGINENSNDTFSKFISNQKKLFQALEANDAEYNATQPSTTLDITVRNSRYKENSAKSMLEEISNLPNVRVAPRSVYRGGPGAARAGAGRGADLPGNAYVFLAFPPRGTEVRDSNDEPHGPGARPKNKKKKRPKPAEPAKPKDATTKDNIRTILLKNLYKSDATDKAVSKAGTAGAAQEVDSAIPFNCITTSEVVDSCSTTPSSASAAVAEDPKLLPLQLASSYRAVSSVTGVASPPPAPRPQEPRAFNGLPLARAGFGASASAALDEYKKSLDENGNSVQGINSPPSGSSQPKKIRKKKSSKNETVIKSDQIDGYKGDKDLNELLRFIESHADTGRAHKLPRAKHKDDADDKAGKKRSAERRKDKEKMKRATSMEELSRSSLAELTRRPAPGQAPPKPERRSWGTDQRDVFYYDDPPPSDADFQTVTKKRKPRRRADEPAEPSPPPPPPAPRARRVSAPPSDRSNDDNDDRDSVHSLPDLPAEPAAPPAAAASYADIARTRHNIPDLIESCNFYADGEPAVDARPSPAPAVPDPDYPALEPRRGARPARDARDAPRPDKAPPPPPARKERKERDVAPDVVADRRPPVILLDSPQRPRDMDGITFGFDINEQLLAEGPARRPRCDLVRDAVEGAGAAAAGAGPEAGGPGTEAETGAAAPAVGVAVQAGCTVLRYVPPAITRLDHQLHLIVDYVGGAWEDVVRCGGGKVRYFAD